MVLSSREIVSNVFLAVAVFLSMNQINMLVHRLQRPLYVNQRIHQSDQDRKKVNIVHRIPPMVYIDRPHSIKPIQYWVIVMHLNNINDVHQWDKQLISIQSILVPIKIHIQDNNHYLLPVILKQWLWNSFEWVLSDVDFCSASFCFYAKDEIKLISFFFSWSLDSLLSTI